MCKFASCTYLHRLNAHASSMGFKTRTARAKIVVDSSPFHCIKLLAQAVRQDPLVCKWVCASALTSVHFRCTVVERLAAEK